MDQRTHAWIAVRAIALLDDQKADDSLVSLLKPRACAAAMGAWIPDLSDAKRGGGQTQHHVFKIMPHQGPQKARFVAKKKDLLRRMDGGVYLQALLAADQTLSAKWWSRPFKADPQPGQNLANRAMALCTAMRDLLVLGDPRVEALVPGEVDFLTKMSPSSRTRPDQAALYFFMLSHFLADACMPCHCDSRYLAGYANGLHQQLEKHWHDLIDDASFDKDTLKPRHSAADNTRLLRRARTVDERIGLTFAKPIPKLRTSRDLWLEVVDQCRATFALSNIIAPEKLYPYASKKRAPFKIVFGRERGTLLQLVDQSVLQDAVTNTAMIWRYVWGKVAR